MRPRVPTSPEMAVETGKTVDKEPCDMLQSGRETNKAVRMQRRALVRVKSMSVTAIVIHYIQTIDGANHPMNAREHRDGERGFNRRGAPLHKTESILVQWEVSLRGRRGQSLRRRVDVVEEHSVSLGAKRLQ